MSAHGPFCDLAGDANEGRFRPWSGHPPNHLTPNPGTRPIARASSARQSSASDEPTTGQGSTPDTAGPRGKTGMGRPDTGNCPVPNPTTGSGFKTDVCILSTSRLYHLGLCNSALGRFTI
jgi:hypothetical protein